MFLDLKLEGRLALVIGAGRVGRRKLAALIEAGARIIVAEPEPGPELLALAQAGKAEIRPRFTEDLLAGVSLVFAAADEPELNRAAARAARARGIWVNVADGPEESDFFLPAVITRGNFQAAAGTRGASPALAAAAAGRLRAEFGPEYETLTRWLGLIRPLILNSGLAPAARRARLKSLAESEELRSHLAQGRLSAAALLAARLAAPVSLDGLALD